MKNINNSINNYSNTELLNAAIESGMKLLKRTSLKALEDSIIAYYKEQEKSPHFNNIFNSWIEEKIKYGEIQKQTKDR